MIKRRNLEIILIKCPFALCLNPEFDGFITVDEMTADLRNKTWGVSFPWPHQHSCLPAAPRTGHFCKKSHAIFTWKHRLWVSWTALYNKNLVLFPSKIMLMCWSANWVVANPCMCCIHYPLLSIAFHGRTVVWWYVTQTFLICSVILLIITAMLPLVPRLVLAEKILGISAHYSSL